MREATGGRQPAAVKFPCIRFYVSCKSRVKTHSLPMYLVLSRTVLLKYATHSGPLTRPAAGPASIVDTAFPPRPPCCLDRGLSLVESTVTGRALSGARPNPKPLSGSTEPTSVSAACGIH